MWGVVPAVTPASVRRSTTPSGYPRPLSAPLDLGEAAGLRTRTISNAAAGAAYEFPGAGGRPGFSGFAGAILSTTAWRRSQVQILSP